MRLPFSAILAILASPAFSALLGLDIGHDFTKAVLVAPGVPFEIVMSADSKRKDVSGIAFKQENNEIERIYGSATNSFCIRFPQSCVLNYKNLLGRSIDDPAVKNYLVSHSGVEIVESPNQRNTLSFNINKHKYPIEEVLAMNVQNVVSRATTLLKEKAPGGYSNIEGVAIAVPAHFTQSQRQAVKDAVELAGLNTVALVDDGLAIAINYATKTEFDVGKEYHVIYDMGAGSTSATLVSFSKTDDQTPVEINVEGYAYDESLGGAYFTNKIAELVKEKFLEKHNIGTDKFNANHRSMAKIYQASEKAKLILSANNEASISIESIYDDIDFKTKISRQEFEEYISDVSTSIVAPLLDVFKTQFGGNNVKLEDIKSVIYAGGSTRVPFVNSRLLSLIGEDLVSRTINTDEAAVLGTTLRGVQVSKMFKAKEFNVTEGSIIDYKIDLDDNVETLFPIGTSYKTPALYNLTDSLNENKKLSLDLIENTHHYARYDIDLDDIAKKVPLLNDTTCSNISYYGDFQLTESRIFELNGVKVICNETITRNVPLKPKYLGARPLGTATKLELRNHLQSLNSKDQQRKLFSEKLNELEALLYSSRAYLEEDEVMEKGPESVVTETNSIISEYLEWLDYESDDAKLKDVKERIEKLKSSIKQIKNYIKQAGIPLDVDEFKRIHKEGVLSSNSIQDNLMTAGEEALELAKKYAEAGIDYDKETKKLSKSARDFSISKFENIQKKLTTTFEKIKDLYELSEDEFLEESRESLYNLREEALVVLNEVKNAEAQLKRVHAQRMKEMNNSLNRFIRNQKRKLEKELEKEKVNEQKEDEEVDEEIFEDAVEDQTEEDVRDEL